VSLVDMKGLLEGSRERVARDPGFQMLIASERILKEIDDQDSVSLRESERRVESKARERVLKDQRNAYLRSQGIDPVDEDAEDLDDAALEKQQEVISHIQTREAAHILADYLRGATGERPRAAMRD
jgi:carboxyl-terminal processing protease